MTAPSFTLDKIRAVLGDDAVAKLEAADRPTDLVLVMARKAAAIGLTANGLEGCATDALRGAIDDDHSVRAALAMHAALRDAGMLRDTPATPVADADGWTPWNATADSVNPVPGKWLEVILSNCRRHKMHADVVQWNTSPTFTVAAYCVIGNAS